MSIQADFASSIDFPVERGRTERYRNTEQLKQLNRLEQRLWRSANIIRGRIDAAKFRTPVFPLLFGKCSCNIGDQENEEISQSRWLLPCTVFNYPIAVIGRTCAKPNSTLVLPSNARCGISQRLARQPSTAYLGMSIERTRSGCHSKPARACDRDLLYSDWLGREHSDRREPEKREGRRLKGTRGSRVPISVGKARLDGDANKLRLIPQRKVYWSM